ncbi:RNase adaptor protein RapZ [Actinobacillus delphinicola]|uniref:GlmZ(SRNA)-inactivating NTPase n=1 Tax=Actinobacillus delphinicola TaxID=51161 RepID=A0A448TVY8_9PAST|nr:RNase adapter RapZ [Actinobacillus delphinicola]MDG6896652.1 RNase adaptor protein RapZ [Actinobacillus delphinicola]VEJ10083.1 glmZ(sRNA)-inactivating NTPase [Actinobacillus delphinicola]
MNIIIVSGRSGAGKSIALRALEDIGYYCVDNLPLDLLPQLVDMLGKSQKSVAISLDIRNLPRCPDTLTEMIKQLEQKNHIHIVFLDSDRNVLIRRYSDSRRSHPLSQAQDLSLENAIDQEYAYLLPLREQANLIIDTSKLSVHELASQLRLFAVGKDDKELKIIVQSFGFKYGLPLDADYVFDARFLPNPHWIPELRPHTGLEKEVQDYLAAQTEVQEFLHKTEAYLTEWLPMLEANNRSYLTIAIGCTGGKHRSVYLAEKLGDYFKALGKHVKVQHAALEHQNKKA